jgi:hypothetical protein
MTTLKTNKETTKLRRINSASEAARHCPSGDVSFFLKASKPKRQQKTKGALDNPNHDAKN